MIWFRLNGYEEKDVFLASRTKIRGANRGKMGGVGIITACWKTKIEMGPGAKKGPVNRYLIGLGEFGSKKGHACGWGAAEKGENIGGGAEKH